MNGDNNIITSNRGRRRRRRRLTSGLKEIDRISLVETFMPPPYITIYIYSNTCNSYTRIICALETVSSLCAPSQHKRRRDYTMEPMNHARTRCVGAA